MVLTSNPRNRREHKEARSKPNPKTNKPPPPTPHTPQKKGAKSLKGGGKGTNQDDLVTARIFERKKTVCSSRSWRAWGEGILVFNEGENYEVASIYTELFKAKRQDKKGGGDKVYAEKKEGVEGKDINIPIREQGKGDNKFEERSRRFVNKKLCVRGVKKFRGEIL